MINSKVFFTLILLFVLFFLKACMVSNKHAKVNNKELSDSEICKNTTILTDGKITWKNGNFKSLHEEAYNRGLECIVNKKKIDEISSKNNSEIRPLARYSNEVICEVATKKYEEKKVWNDKKYNYIREAEFRGLDCGVEEIDYAYTIALKNLEFNPRAHFLQAKEFLHQNPSIKGIVARAFKLEVNFFANGRPQEFAESLNDITDVLEIVNWNFVDIKTKAKVYFLVNTEYSKFDLFQTENIKKNMKKMKFSEDLYERINLKNSRVAEIFLNERITENCSNINYAIENNKLSNYFIKLNPNIKEFFKSCNLGNANVFKYNHGKNYDSKVTLKKNENKIIQRKEKDNINQIVKKEIGSGFYVSKLRHIITNYHVVSGCSRITVGSSIKTQVPANIIARDKKNDLALLQSSSLDLVSSKTKTFIEKLSIEIMPILSGGLIRSNDVIGGEEILVAGYPLGNIVSDTIKVTRGIVSATKGMDDNISHFEIDAVIKKGNSGGPIYDKRGNIVGVAVSRLNLNKVDYVNFGIKGSLVKHFLSIHDIPIKWSNRKKIVPTEDLYKIALKQTIMVICNR